MKKLLTIFAVTAALALSLGVLVGCSSSSSSASGSAPAGVPNPMRQVTTMSELAQETGVNLTTDPAWASQKFFVYEIDGGKMAEVQFTVSDYQGSLRAMATSDTTAKIHGISGNYDYTTIYRDGLDSVEGGRILMSTLPDKKTAFAAWYNRANGTAYSVSLVAPINRNVDTLLADLTKVLNTIVD